MSLQVRNVRSFLLQARSILESSVFGCLDLLWAPLKSKSNSCNRPEHVW